MFFVYILYSKSIMKYYVGHTDNVGRRLNEHNSGQTIYTARGKPWEFIYKEETITRSEAMKLESKIKKRGIYRYLKAKGVA
jgi:putative endonuclease